MSEPVNIIDAAIEGDLARVQQILAEDPSQANHRGSFIDSTPLVFAAHRGHIDVVCALLEAGARTGDREGASDSTALHWAAEGGHPDVVGALLDHGAAIDPVDRWYELSPVGWTTVVSWAEHRHRDRAGARALLLDRGAKLDPFSAIRLKDASGLALALDAAPAELHRRLGLIKRYAQPIHMAAEIGDRPIVDVLLARGADCNATTAWGTSALALAIRGGHATIADEMRSAGAKADVSAVLAAGDRDEAARMLANSAPPAGLLHAIVAAGDVESIALLITHGSDPNVMVPSVLNEIISAEAPLHLAAASGDVEVARCLLDRGADVDILAPATNLTPLIRAASRGRLEMVKLLLERGASRDIQDAQHRATAAGWAAYNKHTAVIDMLRA